MSSNIEIEKACQLCGRKFIARKTTTEYCSHKCASQAYKQRKREEKIQKVADDISIHANFNESAPLNEKEFLNVNQTAILLGIGRATLYRYIAANEIKCKRIKGKTFIRRKDIETLFDKVEAYEPKQSKPRNPITEFYTMEDIKFRYNLRESWIYRMINEHSIPKTAHRGKTLYSKKHIEKHFATYEQSNGIIEWYCVDEIQSKFNMTPTAIYNFACMHNIPRNKSGKFVCYSKEHFNVAKGLIAAPEPQYYTVAEAMSKFNMTRDGLYHYMKHYNVPKIKEGRYIKISRAELDELLEPPVII